MEPTTVVTGLTAASAVMGAAQDAQSLIKKGFRRLRLLGTFDPAWLDLAYDGLISYADRLMQEIARWFYSTPSTQSGLEEQQIARVLAQYMVDVLGFAAGDAERAARDFLSFCAGRAWLLGSVGTNSYGQRLFQFTHRTFYEFFAAESLARQSETVDDICNHIENAWVRDSTSVVPELLVQAYDYSHERGAARVFQQLCVCARSARTLLLLRVIEGTILPSYARKTGFNLIIDRWQSAPTNFRGVEFSSLLSMNPQARGQFVEDYLRPDTALHSTSLFLDGWASLQNSGLGETFRDRWDPIVEEILQAVPAGSISEHIESSAFDNWAIGAGYEVPITQTGTGYLVAGGGIYGPTPGAVWWMIESVFGHGRPLELNSVKSAVIKQTHQALSTSGIPSRYIHELYEQLIELGKPFLEWRSVELLRVEGKYLSEIFAILMLAFAECVEDEDFVRATGPAWEYPITSIVNVRAWKVLEGERPSREEQDAARKALRKLPKFFREWAAGDRQFVIYEGQ